jgi:hypothetical protein
VKNELSTLVHIPNVIVVLAVVFGIQDTTVFGDLHHSGFIVARFPLTSNSNFCIQDATVIGALHHSGLLWPFLGGVVGYDSTALYQRLLISSHNNKTSTVSYYRWWFFMGAQP